MSVIPHPTRHKRFRGETWWQIILGRGKNREYVTFEGTFAEAKEYELELRLIDEPAVVITSTIKDFILPFLDYYANEVAESTLEDMNDTINLYLIPHFGALRPDRITDKVVNDFKKALLEKGLKPVTINKHINYLSSILKWAASNVDCCRGLDVKLKRFPKKKTVSKQVVPLTRRQVNGIYKNIQPQFRLLFLLMADQALRIHEAVKVRVEDIDEENEVIHVTGKGSKVRQVPYMSKRFAEELDKVLDEKIDGYLIVNPQTKKPYVTIRIELQKAANAAGLTRIVNHHLLRHSCSTRCAEQGMNPHALQKILGHASIETTNKIYTHVSRDFVGDEARKMKMA